MSARTESASCRRSHRMTRHIRVVNRVRRAGAVLALVLVTGIGACGSPATDAGAGSTAVPTGGTLRIAIGASEPELNILEYKNHSFDVLDQIYEPLVRYGADGKLQPALAESWGVSGDGLTMTFQLRRGVTFSDGTPFDATVAKQDLGRWLGQKKHAFLGVSSDVASVDTPDDHTLVMHLTKAYYPALQELSVVRPVRFQGPNSFNADGSFQAPIGTGPYKLASSTETEVTLVRNDTYWGGRPNLDKVIFKVIPDSQQRLAALKAGDVDMIGGDYLAPLAPEEAAALKSQPGAQVLTQPASVNLLLAFNTTTGNPALVDPAVRQAINLAVDRTGYASTLFNGLATPATQLFPPSIPYAPAAGSRPIEHSPDKAVAVLQQAGWTGTGTRAKGNTTLSLRLILDPNLLPQSKALSEAVQADLRKVGIDVQIESLDSTAYADKSSKRDYDLEFYETYGPPYDPFAMLNSNFRTQESANLYSSPEIDKLIDAALAGTTDTDRAAAYNQVWTALNDNWAVASLVELPRVWAIRSTVRGFTLGATEYDLPLRTVGVAS